MSRTRVALATLIALCATAFAGCAINPDPVSTAGRPDITAAPPKSMTAAGAEKAKAAQKKNRKATKKAVPGTSARKKAARGEDAATWPEMTETMTQVRFRMPSEVEPVMGVAKTADGGTAPSTRAVLPLADGASMTVFTTVTPGREVTTDSLSALLDTAVTALRETTARDVRVVDRRSTTVLDRPALDAILTFTADDGSTAYIRERFVGSRQKVVNLETMVRSTSVDDAARARVDRLHDRFTASLVFI